MFKSECVSKPSHLPIIPIYTAYYCHELHLKIRPYFTLYQVSKHVSHILSSILLSIEMYCSKLKLYQL